LQKKYSRGRDGGREKKEKEGRKGGSGERKLSFIAYSTFGRQK
jgi:hypothetical protein